MATYGQVAGLAGLPRRARQVGYALHALAENSALPWHRVVNSKGTISRRSNALGVGAGRRPGEPLTGAEPPPIPLDARRRGEGAAAVA